MKSSAWRVHDGCSPADIPRTEFRLHPSIPMIADLEHEGVPRFENGRCVFEERGEFGLDPLIGAYDNEDVEVSETSLQRVDRTRTERRAQSTRHHLQVPDGAGGIAHRDERRCDHPVGNKHCGMEFTEHSYSVSEERLEEFEPFLEQALVEPRLRKDAPSRQGCRMIVAETFPHRVDVAPELFDFDLTRPSRGGNEVEPACEHVWILGSEHSLTVVEQRLMKCDCRVSSPSQRVELRDVSARLECLAMVVAQDTIAIGEETLGHQECLFGATAPTD